MPVCKTCKHLMEPNHSCPSPEYKKARDQLVHSAARAEEVFSENELEDFARKHQQFHEGDRN